MAKKPTVYDSVKVRENIEVVGTITNTTLDAALAALNASAAKSVKYVKVGAEIVEDYTSGVAKAMLVANVPVTSMITHVQCEVKAAFNSGESDTLQIGTADDPDAFLGTSDITTTAIGVYTKAVGYHVGATALPLYATWTGGGTAPTDGAFDVYVGYIDL